MNDYQIQGRVEAVESDTININGQDMDKATVVVNDLSGQYAKSVAIDFWKDKAANLSEIVSVGSKVTVKATARSKSYSFTGKDGSRRSGWNTSLTGQEINVLDQPQNNDPGVPEIPF